MTAAFSIEPTRREIARLERWTYAVSAVNRPTPLDDEMSQVIPLLCRKMFAIMATI
jgi:hypothetical protein